MEIRQSLQRKFLYRQAGLFIFKQPTNPTMTGYFIKLKGPEDLAPASTTSGPDPLGFDWEGLAESRGTAGGHSGPPPIKQPQD